MPLVRRRVRVSLGTPTDDVVDYEHEDTREYDFVFSGNIRLNSTTAWVGPTELAGMPDVVDLMVENTDAADDIRVYHSYGLSAYKTLEPGESYYWSSLAKGTSPNQWRIIGQGAGIVDCKVTVVGND